MSREADIAAMRLALEALVEVQLGRRSNRPGWEVSLMGRDAIAALKVRIEEAEIEALKE